MPVPHAPFNGRLLQPAPQLDVAPPHVLGRQRLPSKAAFANMASCKVVAAVAPAQVADVLYRCCAEHFGHAQGSGVPEWQTPDRHALRSLARDRVVAPAVLHGRFVAVLSASQTGS